MYGGVLAPTAPTPTTAGGYQGVSPPTNTPAQPTAPQPSPLQNIGNTISDFVSPKPQQPAPSLYDQVNQQPPQQNVFQKAAGFVQSEVGGAISGFQNTPTTPKTTTNLAQATYEGTVSGLSDAFMQGKQALDEQLPTIMDSHFTALQRGAAVDNVVNGTVGALFTALLGPVQGLAKVQGVGYIVDGANALLNGMTQGSASGALYALNQSSFSPETKKALAKPVYDTTEIIAGLMAGKVADVAGKSGWAALTDNSKEIMTQLSNDPAIKQAIADSQKPPVKVPVTSEGGSTPVKVNTPTTKQAAYAKSQGYEGIKPDSQLPTIEMGAKPKSTEPVIQTEPSQGLPAPAGMKVEPIKSPIQPNDIQKPQENPASTPEAAVPQIERATVNGETTTKAANDINETLVKKGIEQLTPEQQSTYQSGSYKDSAAKVTQMLTDNVEATKEMAKTGENVPEGVHPQILFNAVEALANKESDIQLLRDLAKSPLGTELSESGSTLGSHGFNDNPNSTVKAIRDVNKARGAALKKKGTDVSKETAKDTASFKEKVKSARSTRQSWAELVQKISCQI